MTDRGYRLAPIEGGCQSTTPAHPAYNEPPPRGWDFCEVDSCEARHPIIAPAPEARGIWGAGPCPTCNDDADACICPAPESAPPETQGEGERRMGFADTCEPAPPWYCRECGVRMGEHPLHAPSCLSALGAKWLRESADTSLDGEVRGTLRDCANELRCTQRAAPVAPQEGERERCGSAALYPPPAFGFTRVPIDVDRCIALEVLDLWAAGVRTTLSCCGHGRGVARVISVVPEHATAMRDLGYTSAPDPPGFKSPDFTDPLFVPKSQCALTRTEGER